MAKLNSASTTIEIVPYRRETPTSNWIETIIALEYHIQDQKLRFELPSSGVSIQVEDFNRLIDGTKTYIKTLPTQVTSLKEPLDVYYFSPLECDFDLEFGSGFYFDDSHQDGIIYVDFKMSLRAFGINTLSGDRIGCVVEVKISTLLDFLDNLKQEVNAILTTD